MRTATRRAVGLRGAALAAWLATMGLIGCGGKPSLGERMAGTFATDAVQAELEEHEKEFITADLHGRFDAFDRAEAEEEGAVWARLRLHGDGRFDYEGPASDGGAADASLRGRWTARPGFVDLVVEHAGGTGAEDVPKDLACPATPQWIDLPFLTDASTRAAVRLDRR